MMAHMAKKYAAGIIGAGIAGLSAAIGLRQAGYEVSILERAPSISPIGAALSLWENAILALRELGAAERIEREAAPIQSVSIRDCHGRTILKALPAARDTAGQSLAFLPTRSLLQQTLLEIAGPEAVKLNCQVAAVSQNGHVAIVHENDGRQSKFDLVVAADGIWSATAHSMGPPPYHAGYGGFLALSDAVEAGGIAGTGELCEYWGPGVRFGIGNAGQGGRYWYCLLNEPAPNACNSMSLSGVTEQFQHWPKEISQVLAATAPERLIPFSVHAKPAPRSLGEGRIIVAGDAAHAMQPNLGQGACQAIEDALALREAARRYPPEHIAEAYARMRLGRVRFIVRSSAYIGHLSHGLPKPVTRFMHRATAYLPTSVNALNFNLVRRLPDYASLA